MGPRQLVRRFDGECARSACPAPLPLLATDPDTALLDFPTPNGLTLNFSSLASPNFATSYSLANAGAVDGSLAYLYSSLPLHGAAKTAANPRRRVHR